MQWDRSPWGTLNHHGALTIRVARAGTDTALARIARAVEDAQAQKAPIARLADRVAAVFVPGVLVIAAATFAVWLLVGDASVALERMIAVLVIACPCALGLATPAAVAVGTARGAELGVLFKGGGALETASALSVVCFDKTGTLTSGKPTLVAATSDDVLRVAASIEQHSEHPIARAIVEGALARGLALVAATGVTVEPGGGLTGTADGKHIRIGTREFLALAGLTVPERTVPHTVAYVAIDAIYAGAIDVADPARMDAASVVATLRALAVEPIILTGDRLAAAQPIADAVGITKLHAGLTPLRKAEIVTAERAGGHVVAMVGDGINDAPALAAADRGIALGSGTEIAAAAADVTLLRDGISLLPTALSLARATLHTLRRNLVAAFAYNLVCIPIAAGALYPITGWQLSPVLASAAMSLSSISVLLSSLRLRTFAPDKP
jgi:Cu+-exporting ATPase